MSEVLPENTFANRIATLISLVGSKEKLGKLAQISAVMIGKYETGQSEPSRDKLIALANAAKVNVLWLATGEGPMKRGETVSAEGYTTGKDLGADFVLVPRYNVGASAGGGAIIHSEQIVDHLAFRSEWVRSALDVSVKDLALISVKGDSMEPTLSNGDMILVDTGTRKVEDNAIYVLRYNGALMVKRIQRKVDGTLIIKSDNIVYEPETVEGDAVDQLHVVGRVVWSGRRM